MEGEAHGVSNEKTQSLLKEVEYWKSELGRRPGPEEVGTFFVHRSTFSISARLLCWRKNSKEAKNVDGKRYILPGPPLLVVRCQLNIVITQEQELQSLSTKLMESESGRRAAVAINEALEKVCLTSLRSRFSTQYDTGSREALPHAR